MNEKKKAVAEVADVKRSDLEKSNWDHYGLEVYSLGDMEFAVGTDEEADAAAKEYIRSTVWAFNAPWLAEQTGFDVEVFRALQPRCEDSNEAILSLIEASEGGFDSFLEESIGADGRGHFLSSYDGNESEAEINGTTYYVYRTQ